MAKKHSKDELKAYFTKLAEGSGLPPEKLQSVLDALDHDGFASKVDTEGVMLRSEFSRVLNEEVAPLKAQHQKAYNELVNDWFPKVKAEHEAAAARALEAEKRVAAYESRFGAIDEAEDIGGGRVRTETGDVIRKADFEKILESERARSRAEAVQESVGITLLVQKLAADHWREFGEVLDTDPLVAAVKARRDAGDQQFDLRAAYEAEYRPKLDEKRDTARRKEIDDAVAKARMDERTRLASSPAAVVDEDSVGPFFAAQALARSGKAPSEAELEADFIRGMREGATAQPGTS